MNLKETLSLLNNKYPQSTILLETFCFETLCIKEMPQPKYLFRGESDIYKTTEATFWRNFKSGIFNNAQWHLVFFLTYRLYLFLREFLWGIPEIDNSHKNALVDVYISGLLQHYGFNTAFIDLTSDLNVVAHFCANNSIGRKGKILVMKTEQIINQCFDFTQCPGDRPQKQKAFALWDQDNSFNLKNQNLLDNLSAKWFDFDLCDNDKIYYKPDYYLPLGNDIISDAIIDWYYSLEIKDKIRDNHVMVYYDKIINNLKNEKNDN